MGEEGGSGLAYIASERMRQAARDAFPRDQRSILRFSPAQGGEASRGGCAQDRPTPWPRHATRAHAARDDCRKE